MVNRVNIILSSNMQNLVIVSHTVCVQLGHKNLGMLWPCPLGWGHG